MVILHLQRDPEGLCHCLQHEVLEADKVRVPLRVQLRLRDQLGLEVGDVGDE